MARLVRLTRMSMQKVHATSGADAELEAARMVGDKHRALTLLMARYGAGIGGYQITESSVRCSCHQAVLKIGRR